MSTCFPTGRHYPGIAHLMGGLVRGLAKGWSATDPWQSIPVALIDVETTGTNPATDRVIELGIVVGISGEPIQRYNWLINPGRPIPTDATAVHGISDADVADKPRFEDIASEVATALSCAVPAAYNASFDRQFLVAEFARAGVPLSNDVDWIDPLVWARELYSKEKSRVLSEMASRLGVTLENAHRASDDAEAALKILYILGKDMRVPRAYGAFIQEQRRLSYQQADARRKWSR